MRKTFSCNIFRQSTKSYPIPRFEDPNPVQRYQSMIHHFVNSNWYLHASYVICRLHCHRTFARLLHCCCSKTIAGPGRGTWCPGEGCPRLGTLHPPTARSWGRRLRPAARFPWLRGLPAWGPDTNPTAHALASWLCAVWGRNKGAQWGAPHASVRGVQGVALSIPRTARPWGVRPGPANPWLWVPCASSGAHSFHWARMFAAATLGGVIRFPRNLLPCRGSVLGMRASGVCATSWPLLLDTCPCALVEAGGVPFRRACPS